MIYEKSHKNFYNKSGYIIFIIIIYILIHIFNKLNWIFQLNIILFINIKYHKYQ